MRVVIDLQGAQTSSRLRGIGRYSLLLTQCMARNPGLHEIWLVLNAALPDTVRPLMDAFKGLIPRERIRVFDAPVDERLDSWNNRAAEIIREEFIDALHPDVVLITSVVESHWERAVTSIGARSNAQRTAAILYDLIPLLNPQQYLTSDELREHYMRKVGWLKNAGMLLAISASSRREGLLHLNKASTDIVNISAAIDPKFAPVAPEPEVGQALLLHLGITRKPVLYVPGGYDPRKNFDGLISAYSQLSPALRATHQLVIVLGLHGSHRQRLIESARSHGLADEELVLPGYVPDDELMVLFGRAAVFVFASLHEGFGLPALEAMACGAPVIGANRTSVPEVIGLDEALFDPLSSASIAEKMTQVLTDPAFRERLRLHGLQQAGHFSWHACATSAFGALEALAQRVGRPAPVTPEASHEYTHALLARLSQLLAPDDAALRQAARCLAFNRAPARRQLMLDVSEIAKGDARSGIQRVVRSILSECLHTSTPDFEIRPIYFDGTRYRYANRYAAQILKQDHVGNDDAIDVHQDDVYLSLDLTMRMTEQLHPVLAALASRGMRLYFIVYDILLVRNPQWWVEGAEQDFKRWLNSIAELGTGLACISEAVATDLKAWLAERPDAAKRNTPLIRSFHLGADVQNSLPTSGMPDNAMQVLISLKARPTVLMVGTLEPRKGHIQALNAFELLWAAGVDMNLVIVGKRGWLTDDLPPRLQHGPESGKRLFWLEGISDEYLEEVYAASSLLLVPSEGEGFGLPLIEAAQHQLPILARDLPVFREVAGPHAAYFNGLEPLHLKQALLDWLSTYQTDTHPKSIGMPWLNWHQSTQQLLGIIRAFEQR